MISLWSWRSAVSIGGARRSRRSSLLSVRSRCTAVWNTLKADGIGVLTNYRDKWLGYPKEATAMMSTCIIAARGVMLPIALLVGYKADTWGRKPLFLVGFAILPIGAVLYTLSDDSSG